MVLPLVFYNPRLVAATGAKNWVFFGGMTLFQPSEFMKISYILMLAYIIVTFTKNHKKDARTIGLDFLLILWMVLFTIPVLVLLALQSDLGTALVFVAIFAGMVFIIRSFLENYYPDFSNSYVCYCWIFSHLHHEGWTSIFASNWDADLSN